MVNEDLVNYLREGLAKGFEINFLKKQLYNAGFSVNEIEEAARFVQPPHTRFVQPSHVRFVQPPRMGKISQEGETDSQINVFNQKEQTKSSSQIILLGGISGILIFVLFLFSIFSGFFLPALGIFSLFIFVVPVIYFILLILFYSAFFSLGKKINSKSLKFSSMSHIVLLVLFSLSSIILFITTLASLQSQINSFYQLGSSYEIGNTPSLNFFGSPTLDFNNLSEAELFQIQSNFLKNEKSNFLSSFEKNPEMSDLIDKLKLPLIILTIFFVFLLIVRFLFAIGLFSTGKFVKLGIFAGILEILYILSLIGFFSAFVYVLYNPLILISIIFGTVSPVLIILGICGLGSLILFPICSLVESICLLIFYKKLNNQSISR